jgi:hypothetical protein
MGTATNSSPSVILGGCLMRLLPIRVAGSCCCAGNTRAMVEVEERRQAASRFPREGCPPSTRRRRRRRRAMANKRKAGDGVIQPGLIEGIDEMMEVQLLGAGQEVSLLPSSPRVSCTDDGWAPGREVLLRDQVQGAHDRVRLGRPPCVLWHGSSPLPRRARLVHRRRHPHHPLSPRPRCESDLCHGEGESWRAPQLPPTLAYVYFRL